MGPVNAGPNCSRKWKRHASLPRTMHERCSTRQPLEAESSAMSKMIALRGIRLESRCVHHLAPIIGQARTAYVPSGRVVGISKLGRVVEAYAKRLQIQERMTAQIANTINSVSKPQGVGVIIKAKHHCTTIRGVHKPDTDLVKPHAGLLPRQSADAARIPRPGSLMTERRSS